MPAEPAPVEIGLVSDTHLPERCAALPAALFQALRGVELVLHAGDVGALSVLDDLAAIAPVVAVHGNDDTAESQCELPFQQVIVAGGRRLLLTHGHEPDRERELANRRDDAWGPKLQRRVDLGRRAGAAVVIFGHTHIPMTYAADGVLLVNPGAIAPPNFATRARRQSVARLTIRADGEPIVRHIDLAAPSEPFVPAIDWDAGFRATHDRFSESIVDPAMAADWPRLADHLLPLAPEVVRAALRRAAFRCWDGHQAAWGHADLLAALRADPDLTPELRARLEAALLAEGGG